MCKRSYHDGDKLTKDELDRMTATNGCPDCGGDLYDGPSAGGNQNVRCSECLAKFNIMPPFGIERISDRSPLYSALLKKLEDKANGNKK